MAHTHHHHHPHGHTHARPHASLGFGRALAAATALQVVLVVVQLIYGVLANSIALLSDAVHNFGDAFGLVLAWAAYGVADWRPTRRYTYGFRSASILAALANGILLLVATGALAWEAVRRFSHPGDIATLTVIWAAGLGVVANALGAWLLTTGRQDDLNIRGAFLHLVSDAAVSVGVILAALAIMQTGWTWLDPLASLVVCAVIVWWSFALLRDAVALSLAAVPPGIDPDRVRRYLAGRTGVTAIHDLHIWAMSTTDTALTCHLVIPAGHPGDGFLAMICEELEHEFSIGHVTLQIETDADAACMQRHHGHAV